MQLKKHKSDLTDIRGRIAKHVALFENFVSPSGVQIASLRLFNPRSNTATLQCTISGRHLAVSGKFVGDASYAWSDRLSWAFLSDCDIDYFASKCCSSGTLVNGRPGFEWNSEKAENRLGEWLKARADETPGPKTIYKVLEGSGVSVDGIHAAAQSPLAFGTMLYEHRKVFGNHPYELADMGCDISIETSLHWLMIHYSMQLVAGVGSPYVPEYPESDEKCPLVLYAPSEKLAKLTKLAGVSQQWRIWRRPNWLVIRESVENEDMVAGVSCEGGGVGDG